MQGDAYGHRRVSRNSTQVGGALEHGLGGQSQNGKEMLWDANVVAVEYTVE